MLTLAQGLSLADVKRAVRATRQLHQPKTGGAKASSPAPVDLRRLRRLPWGTVIAGFAVADKISSGASTGQLCLRVYVRRKVSASRLDISLRIPPFIEIRKGKERFQLPTDVVAMSEDPSAQREIAAAASVGSFTGLTEGTLGLGVVDTSGQTYALTCSHVASPWFRKPLGDSLESPPDRDGEAGPNSIGTVFTWTSLVPGASHSCDAALVIPAAGVQFTNDPLQLNAAAPVGEFNLSDFALDPRRRVQVYSRRKVTSGVIQSILNHFSMTFLGKLFHFREVVEVLYDEPMFGGDSGATVIQTSTRQVLGLHFAGIEGTGTGYFVPIQAITQAFASFGLRPL